MLELNSVRPAAAGTIRRPARRSGSSTPFKRCPDSREKTSPSVGKAERLPAHSNAGKGGGRRHNPDVCHAFGRKTLSGIIPSQFGSAFTARSASSTNSGGKRCSG